MGRVPSPSEPEYLHPGAILDYYLAQEPTGEVKLEILDAQGNVIRTFSSGGPGQTETREQQMRQEAFGRRGTPRLAKSPGMHRFIWDLAYPGPWDPSTGQPGPDGPLAAPGRYQARLTVEGWSATKEFKLLIDPRVAADGVTQLALEEQLQHSLRVRDAISDARRTLVRLREAKERAPEGSAARRRLEALEGQLATASGGGIRYPQPMLIDQLVYLYQMITRADQKLGRDAFERYDELKRELDRIKEELNSIAENNGRR
jgi:hypothetical protein